MNLLPSQCRIWFADQALDFRKGLDGIALECKQHFQKNSSPEACFVFHNKKRSAIKIFYYDGQGYCLFHKRWDRGKIRHFPRPIKGSFFMKDLFSILSQVT